MKYMKSLFSSSVRRELYNADSFCPEFTDPSQEDLCVCECEQSGTMNSQAPLNPDKEVG